MSTKDERIAALEAHVERLTDDMRALISESEGVYGLHLNGDPAPWGELTAGGRCEEWLMSLDDTPATSLARRDARMRAEGWAEASRFIRREYHGHRHLDDIADSVKEVADVVRRQAEEAS